MNILIINHYAGSTDLGMEFRPYYLAKEWIRLGHKVTIIASDFSHVRLIQPRVYFDLQLENKDGINYVWIKTTKYKLSNFRRIINILFFTCKLFIYYKKILALTNPEIVIASSTYPLDIYPAHIIAKKNKADLIYEVHDLWPLSPLLIGGYSKYHPYIFIMQLAENYAYKHSDKVVSILPYAKEYMIKHGLKADKFCHVPNGIVLEDWKNPKVLPERHQMVIDRLKKEKKFLIGYTGAHTNANSLHSIIEAASKLDNKDVAMVLIGSGQEKRKLISYVEKYNFKNIYFLDPIDKFSVPTFLKQMDILYVGLMKAPLYKFGISPNKLFDYMMAAKPIILAIEAENNPINEAHCGLIADPDSLDTIAGAIIKLQSLPEEERKRLGENGYRFVNQYHTYDVLARKFLEFIEKP